MFTDCVYSFISVKTSIKCPFKQALNPIGYNEILKLLISYGTDYLRRSQTFLIFVAINIFNKAMLCDIVTVYSFKLFKFYSGIPVVVLVQILNV